MPLPRPASLRLALLLLPALACASAAATPAATSSAAPALASSPPPISDSVRAANVAVFDAAWRIVHETHFDSTFNGVNWLALRDELRPQAEAARNEEELRRVLRAMLLRLRQSHFALIPREAADGMEAAGREVNKGTDSAAGGPGDAGLSLRLVGDDFVVARVDGGGGAARAGVKPGWVVRRVGDVALADLRGRVPNEMGPRQRRMRAASLATALFGGAAGTTVHAEFVDGSGRVVTPAIVRSPERGEPVKFGNLPPIHTSFERERVTAPGGLTVGVIRFNAWMASIARPFDDAVDAFRGADGVVIDLRGNGGGVGGLVMGIAGHFLTTHDTLGTMRTRRSDLRFVANPRLVSRSGARVRPYDGPVVVLVDALSASTSEVFAGGMQAIGRAHVVGDTTAGMALPALMERLPNRDVLYHAFADFFTPRGERLEGRGVVPDEVVPLTREVLLAGRDPQLEAALRWIQAERAKKAAGTK